MRVRACVWSTTVIQSIPTVYQTSIFYPAVVHRRRVESDQMCGGHTHTHHTLYTEHMYVCRCIYLRLKFVSPEVNKPSAAAAGFIHSVHIICGLYLEQMHAHSISIPPPPFTCLWISNQKKNLQHTRNTSSCCARVRTHEHARSYVCTLLTFPLRRVRAPQRDQSTVVMIRFSYTSMCTSRSHQIIAAS